MRLKVCVKDRGRESKGHSDVVIFLMFFEVLC